MFGLAKEKSLVGLDIGSYSVKAVELKIKEKNEGIQYEVQKVGYEPLPHDAIVEGTIIDSTAVSETIKLLFDNAKIANKDVAISISGNSVIIKKSLCPIWIRKSWPSQSSGKPSTIFLTPMRKPMLTMLSSNHSGHLNQMLIFS